MTTASVFGFRLTQTLVLLTVLMLVSACAKPETAVDKLKRALGDTSLPDAEALSLIAEVTFKDLTRYEATPQADGRFKVMLSVHGLDDASLPASLLKTAEGGLQKAMMNIQVSDLITKMLRYIENGRRRNLGDLTVMWETPISGGEWVDTYEVSLAAESFDTFRQLQSVKGIPARVAAAQNIWKVNVDNFSRFTFEGPK